MPLYVIYLASAGRLNSGQVQTAGNHRVVKRAQKVFVPHVSVFITIRMLAPESLGNIYGKFLNCPVTCQTSRKTVTGLCSAMVTFIYVYVYFHGAIEKAVP